MSSGEYETNRAMRGKMASIKIESCANGWTIAPHQGQYIEVATQTKVARSPKELSGLVEEWANGEGASEEKKKAKQK